MRRRRVVRATVAALACLAIVSPVTWTGTGPAPEASATARSRPDIVVVVTDDQRADSLHAMPILRRRVADRGVTFDNAIVSNPLCCPSRASLLTGAYSHTTGVYTNTYSRRRPYGAWRAFVESGAEEGTIAIALDAAGYETALIGKYLHGLTAMSTPPGWDRFAAFHDQTGVAPTTTTNS